mmetsp:Transcript_20808/g.57803  ORF Transcript_20808/g.57803 Transcript_20808/m.57803 type:complete len:1057 (+) Transcript_20808:140-3310(+)|eukprot:CAMPEP_0172355712 /NCGR_PEP_ID=MMETSP1060-20121228/112_1 /TAXON_ID=37318 /ORGANISM="Pseudo-nitzschia pungens, Strain cf. cingulata" /LENGTH=1056 /DNA_ID=CAMNT_0013075537 /DNA_START=115 /DNA_END=3285 /DNA_ORIENTATION=-
MNYYEFDHYKFEKAVEEAKESVKRVLDIDRSPNLRLAEDVDHEYTDKYKLANLLTNTAIISTLEVLDGLGLTRDVLRTIDRTNQSGKATTMRFESTETRTLVKEETVDIPLARSKIVKEDTTELKDFGTEDRSGTKTTIETIVDRVNRQHYKIDKNWEISIYFGTDVENRRVLQKRTDSTFEWLRDIRIDAPPIPTCLKDEFKIWNTRPTELPLNWLLQQIDTDELKSHFSIDTSPDNTNTRTPRRNLEIEGALEFFRAFVNWTTRIHHKFTIQYPRCIRSGNGTIDKDLEMWMSQLDLLSAADIFVPILPLMERKQNKEGEGEDTTPNDADDSMDVVSLPEGDDAVFEAESPTSPSPLLSASDTTRLLDEQKRTLGEMQKKLEKQFPDPETSHSVISRAEAKIAVLCKHAKKLADQYAESIEYLEFLLEQQLVAAIGKKVTGSDLDRFMTYHNEKLLTPTPKPFCYSIRRPKHYPDGIVSLEKETAVDGDSGKTAMEPISTHVREVTSMVPPTKVPLTAATTIELTGKTYLHGWLNHGFGESHGAPGVRLNARARQFSSFVLLVGTMASNNRMQPKDAIILRNKDELHIPLLLNEIPTATEFKDAISSLSTEQQRFAKAFRSMQLESSVLGVCIVQIKPQLEKLLGLPRDSLTKEMKLTEDLTELFVNYQVPSDLVSYDGEMAMGHHEGSDGTESVKDQVANVKEHVNSVLAVIADQKKEQLEEQTRKADMAFEMESSKCPDVVRSKGANLLDGKKVRRMRRGLMGSNAASSSQAACKMMDSSPAFASQAAYGIAIAAAPPAEGCIVSRSMPMSGSLFGSERSNDMDDVKIQSEAEQSLLGTEATADVSGKTPTNQDNGTGISSSKSGTMDFTAMPKLLDRAIELNGKDASIRSTTIKTATEGWIRYRQPNLLAKVQKGIITSGGINNERNRAFDLLDALSRSGSLDIAFSELHVLLCATHRFEKSVMETVIQDNINPIEKLELSTLVMASTILDFPARDLIRNETNRRRLAESFPVLMAAAAAAGDGDAPTSQSASADNAAVEEASSNRTSVEI